MAKSNTPYARNREKYEALVDNAGTLPPQAVELEEAVLGALMLEKDSIIEVQDILSPDAFYKDTHRIIYEAVLGVSHDLEPVDLYTVTERLKREKNLAKVGGASFLAESWFGGARRVSRAYHRSKIHSTRVDSCFDRDSTPIL